MTIDLEKTEYNYLLEFFINISQFEPTVSTFKYMNKSEIQELNLTILVLLKKLSEIMPKVQDRQGD